MKNMFLCLVIFLSISFMASCTPLVHHADPFYDLNGNDHPRGHIPLIHPVEVTRDTFSSAWRLELLDALWIKLPKSQEQEVTAYYGYSHVEELEKFAVKDGVILAYSAFVDSQADATIQNDFYHWFVMVPSQNITKGFHTEEAFRQFIQTLGVQDPVWQTPDEAHKTFLDTGGCLEWIPDCQ